MTNKTRISRLEKKIRPAKEQEDISAMRASILAKLEKACNKENKEPVSPEDLSPEAREILYKLDRMAEDITQRRSSLLRTG